MSLSRVFLEESVMNKFLALYLDGPMQSWGYMSKFDPRTTLGFPTKSGILGMICAAMGIGKQDIKQLANIAKLKMKVHTLTDGKSEIRRITDFHTVGGGFDKETEKQNIVKKASGGVGNTVVTRREFLLDAKFAVILTGDAKLLNEIDSALRNPRWGIWLGRKSCVPTAPVSQGVHESEEDAVSAIRAAFEKTHGEKCQFRKTVTDAASFSEGSDTYMDFPIDFGKRNFSSRRVNIV